MSTTIEAAASWDPHQVWADVCDRLKATLNPATYDFAFERARPLEVTRQRFLLGVDTDFARNWIRQRYMSLLRDALFEVTGRDLEVEIRVDPISPPADAASLDHDEPAPPRELPRSQGRLQPRFTFDSFVQGPSNRFAHVAALAVAESPARAYNPLFVYGGVGLGKTHLLQAIGHFVDANYPELSFLYVSVETFTNEFINALRDGGIRSFKDRYRNVDVLLIDDIQSLQGREQTQEEFFHTFNALHDSGKQIVISSDRPPNAIATLEDRLRSRFEMGLITDIQPPDVETRIAILQKRVLRDNLNCHNIDVLSFIAERVTTNVRALEGALTRVLSHASISNRPANVELASEVLQDLYPPGDGLVSIEAIQREVAMHFSVTIEELKGQKRTRHIVTPRQVAMYLCRELTESSLPAIGRAFGNRDHTTVMYAVQKVANQMADEGDILSAVETLTARLRGSGGA
ncbi:MAG: chromosomal replication initiator protein DnaA [Methylobacteriaceae bacterium]|nr:chromosomal replication initiator protein DnaA [Methylobacteriaceae bacterium]